MVGEITFITQKYLDIVSIEKDKEENYKIWYCLFYTRKRYNNPAVTAGSIIRVQTHP